MIAVTNEGLYGPLQSVIHVPHENQLGRTGDTPGVRAGFVEFSRLPGSGSCRSRTLGRFARAIQPFQVLRPADHVPIFVDVNIIQQFMKPSAKTVRWDRDALMD